MRDTVRKIILLLVFCAMQACGQLTESDGASGSGSASNPSEQLKEVNQSDESQPMGFRYAPARWRLARFKELDRTTLWIGHIAIRHHQSTSDTFRPGNWIPDSPNPKRNVAEAWDLADKVAARAIANPDNFEQLARQYSEDIVSRDYGGMLGGVRASQLTSNGFLDALAVMKPGEVSKPFRSPYGFHILKRYPPPPAEQVAGERIVIGYQNVFGLVDKSTRSRAEALQLAKEVADLAKKSGQEFRTLVDRYSESVDRARHGDIGVYSTRDPEYLPLEIHLLAQRKEGDVVGPIDSRFGFEILRRVPAQPRMEYAMTAVALPLDNRPTEREASKVQVLKQVETIRRELEKKPERFEEFQRVHCCDRIERWTRGKGDVNLSRALEGVSLGKIAPEPVLYENAYLLVKRLDPNTLPPVKPRLYELPNPSDPDYEALMKFNNGTRIAGAARSFIKEVQTSAKLNPSATQLIGESLDSLIATLEMYPDDHSSVRKSIYDWLAMLETKLDADQFSRFKSFGRKWAVRLMMPPDSVD